MLPSVPLGLTRCRAIAIAACTVSTWFSKLDNEVGILRMKREVSLDSLEVEGRSGLCAKGFSSEVARSGKDMIATK